MWLHAQAAMGAARSHEWPGQGPQHYLAQHRGSRQALSLGAWGGSGEAGGEGSFLADVPMENAAHLYTQGLPLPVAPYVLPNSGPERLQSHPGLMPPAGAVRARNTHRTVPPTPTASVARMAAWPLSVCLSVCRTLEKPVIKLNSPSSFLLWCPGLGIFSFCLVTCLWIVLSVYSLLGVYQTNELHYMRLVLKSLSNTKYQENYSEAPVKYIILVWQLSEGPTHPVFPPACCSSISTRLK